MSRSPFVEHGGDAAEGVPESTVVGKDPALPQFARLPVQPDVLVVAVLLVGAVHQPRCCRDDRNHDVGVVDFFVDPRLHEPVVIGIPRELLYPAGRGTGDAGGKGVGEPGRLDRVGVGAVDDRDAVAEHVGRGLNRQLGDGDLRLVGDASGLRSGALLEVCRDVVAPEPHQVGALSGGVGDDH